MIHIEDSGFIKRSKRLTDDVYSQVLDSVVVACVDCALVCKNKIFLGKRTDMPAKDEYWVQGGRMLVGVDPRKTVQTILMREIGLDIPRLEDIVDLNLTISYTWKDRSQPPEGHGCHMVGMYYMVKLEDAYEERLGLLEPNQNFSSFKWNYLLNVVCNSEFHSGMQKLASRIMECI